MPVVSFPKGNELGTAAKQPESRRNKRLWNPEFGCYVIRIAYEPASCCGVLDIQGNEINIEKAFRLLTKLDPKICWLDVYGDIDGEPVAQTYYSTGDTWWRVG